VRILSIDQAHRTLVTLMCHCYMYSLHIHGAVAALVKVAFYAGGIPIRFSTPY
jgi:hypothetical protein